MEPDKASWSAIATAGARAIHAERVRPLVFHDYMARSLLTDEEMRMAEDIAIDALVRARPELAGQDRFLLLRELGRQPRGVGAGVLSRSRYAEERLAEMIMAGVSQYVILGAGFDTFSLRRPDLSQNLRIFELDHPNSQSLKRERIERSGLAFPANLHFVPLDFETEDVGAELKRASFDSTLPAFFAWLGVTPYLTPSAVYRTLSSLRRISATSSQIVFDYLELSLFSDECESAEVRMLFEVVASRGEPFQAGFEPEQLGTELSSLGWELVEELSLNEQIERYFMNRKDGLRPIMGRYARARAV